MAAIYPTEAHVASARDDEKDIVSSQPAVEIPEDAKTESDSDSGHMQEGVKRVEAITAVWSKKSLWWTFVL